MNTLTRTGSVVLLLIGLPWLTGAASAAALIHTQAPCVGAGFCIGFTFADAIPVIRSIILNAPSAGTAQVTFNGSMTCTIVNNTATTLDSQIVTGSGQVANKDGPGGLQHKAFHGENDITGDSQVTFNLASTRAVSIAGAGVRRFFFKINKVAMTAGFCTIHNAAFSVIFIP